VVFQISKEKEGASFSLSPPNKTSKIGCGARRQEKIPENQTRRFTKKNSQN